MVRGRARRGARGRRGRGRGWSTVEREEDETQAYLRQAIATSARIGAEGRPVKKRRVAGKLVLEAESETEESKQKDTSATAAEQAEQSERETTPLPQQTAYADSEDSDDSDFEDVDLAATAAEAGPSSRANSEVPEELNIVLGKKNDDAASTTPRRKGVTAKERQLRIEIHKVHVLCLMSHVSIRNHWCNDASIQATLRNLLSRKTIDFLMDDDTQSQFQRSQRFKEGLDQALESFSQNFKISSRGMARSFWAESVDDIGRLDIPEDIDLPMKKADFRKCAIERKASRDIGAQLFCAMLRGLGMEARLVCSLQPLPITSAVKGVAPEIRKLASTIPHRETRIGFSPGPGATSDSSANEGMSPRPIGARITSRLTPSRNRAVTPSRTGALPRPASEIKKRQTPESRFPVYWVEVLESAYQRWTAVDPLVTQTIGKPAKLEPPASDQLNAMSYVIAFEEDGSARDVTKRYTKAYNAKTRKLRIEATKHGEQWWKRILRLYRKQLQEPRDQIEDRQLASKEAAEEMPKNIQDFKDHPYYALKRHLRKNEVIHPERQIGKVFTGKILGNETKESEAVYRRKDVLALKSADSWYRQGREVKPGEAPLKWAQPRPSKSRIPEEPDPDEPASPGTPLFAAFQTVIYRPPPVVRGRVPKNRFGNLDIYTPSMIPPGGVHIAHPGTRNAARVLGIDYADAVTGFEFRGRQGTAVVRGAVIAVQHLDALLDVIRGFAYDETAEAADRRSENALKLWRHFMSALRIRERVQGYAVEGEEEENDPESASASEDESPEDDLDGEDAEAVEFLPSYEDFLASQPPIEVVHSTAAHPTPEQLPRASAKAPSPIPKQSQLQANGSTTTEAQTASGGGFVTQETQGHEDLGGGFFTGDADDAPDLGGFVPNTDTEPGGFVPESEPEPECDIPMPSTEEQADPEPEPMTDVDKTTKADEIIDDPSNANQEENKTSQEPKELEMTDASPSKTPSPPDALPEQPANMTRQESDKGSLLSHDPEDDDADPEWLM